MKGKFIGFRTEEETKSEAEKIAKLENMSLSEWSELQLKIGINNFKKNLKTIS